MPAIAEPPTNMGSAVPSSAGEIHVGADGGFGGAPASTPIKPAVSPKPSVPPPKTPTPSAREAMDAALTKRIKPGTGTDTQPEKPMGQVPAEAVKPDPTDGTSAEEQDAAGAESENADGTTGSKDSGSAKSATERKKVNPWKLVDEHKKARAEAEQQIADLKKLVPNEAARKTELAELEQSRTRLKELEDEIRYVNYSKSPEFKTKYQEPYEKAWSRAMSELKEISIKTETGERAVTAQDMLELVNAPLGRAREIANTMFGDFADDVMAHRKEIKNLFDAQSTALEEARVKGAEREQKMKSEYQTRMELVHKQVADSWAKANELVTKDEKYGAMFVPIEGDQDGNQRLAKGFELVDRAFKENPMDPNLTDEQRESIIKRHAAVRNRAAAFGRLLNQNNQFKTRIAELEKELSEFKSSTPAATGGQAIKGTAGPMSARERMEAALASKIRPGSA